LWRKELKIRKNRVTNTNIIELVPEERDILTLFFSNTSYQDIVQKMGYNSETVARQRVFKCKSKLTETVKNDERYRSLKKL